jgi:electron transfer flavoprotein beta subunit
MHIVVCLKQVPRDNSVTINPDRSVNADGIEKMINLFDEYALEEALLIAERHGGSVTALTIGDASCVEQLRRALAMGASDALLLSDAAFANLDTLGAARVAAAAIGKLSDVGLVLAGRNSTDDESGAFAPALARLLGWPPVTYVGKVVELTPGEQVVAERHLESAVETVATRLPAVLSVVKDINEPRYPSLLKIKRVARVDPPVWGAADLGLGDITALVTVSERVPPPASPGGQIIAEGDAAARVRALVEKLAQDQLV